MGGKRITYQNIADESGLSVATISRVLNKPSSASASRNRIINAIISLDGNPSDFGLLESEDKIIIFNTPTPSNPFYFPIITAARERAALSGYFLLENESDLSGDSLERYISILNSTKAVGSIIANAMEKEAIERIDRVVPAVMCSEAASGSSVPFVVIDNVAAAFNAVTYLSSTGRKRIAMLNGPYSFIYSGDRCVGYRKALERAGLEFRQEYLIQVGSHMDFDMAEAAVRRLLSLSTPPDALFCISDMLAAVAIHAALKMGFKVPDDIAVQGFDDMPICRMIKPSISTVKQPVQQMGMLSAEMLLERIADRNVHQSSISLDTELVIREST